MPTPDIGFRTVFDTSVPCKTNLLGVKGVGELGTIGATPAVVNAVVDALASAGLGRDAEGADAADRAHRLAGAAAATSMRWPGAPDQRRATMSISTSAPLARPVTPMQVRAGRLPSGK